MEHRIVALGKRGGNPGRSRDGKEVWLVNHNCPSPLGFFVSVDSEES